MDRYIGALAPRAARPADADDIDFPQAGGCVVSQRTSGAYRLVGFPQFYRALQETLGGPGARRRMIDTLMRPPAAGRILDLGCGAAHVLHLLPLQCEYTGIDANARHIEAARISYGSRGTFLCGDFSLARQLQNKRFDLVVMLGLLHHLGDDEAVTALRLAGDLLAPGGRVFTLDPCRAPGQHPIARFLINRDSGQA